MTKATTANPSRRSWTDGQSATSNRKSMLAFLSILVAALTIAFVWFVFNFGKKEETFLLPLSVSSYAKNIPKANYGIWDPSAFDEKLKSNGLKPWTFSAPAKLENQPQIIARLASFVDELKAKRRDPAKSTVLVQLRCHAVVTDNGKDEWSCGLFVGESAAPAAMFPVSELLAKLNEIPAGNIVIFADVCDLKGVASNGWLSNPVTSYFKNACESWKNSSKKNLWVVCAADDYQDTFYSDLRRKTLFQEACEDAVQYNYKKDLNLFDYFESLYRYCKTASNGRQTPKLILANGTRTQMLSAESKPEMEKTARKVLVSSWSRFSTTPSNASKTKKDKETSPAKTTTSTFPNTRSKSGDVRYVSMDSI